MVSSIAIYCLHTVKWFQVLLFNTDSFICTVTWFQVLLFIACTQLNSFKYCYLILIVLFAHSYMVSSIAIYRKNKNKEMNMVQEKKNKRLEILATLAILHPPQKYPFNKIFLGREKIVLDLFNY